jgi:hypothetical protein
MTPEDVDTQASGLSFHSKSRLNSPRALARIPESDDDNVLPSFQNQQLKRMQPYSLTLSPLTRALSTTLPPFSPTTHLGFSAGKSHLMSSSQLYGKPHRPAPLISFNRLSRRRLEQPCQPPHPAFHARPELKVARIPW